jgi:hypothetical protein
MEKNTIFKKEYNFDFSPGFPTLFTFYYLIISANEGKLRRINSNGDWVDKEYFIEKSKYFLPNIETNKLLDFIDNYQDIDLYKKGITLVGLLSKHIEVFGNPIEVPIKGIHPILINAIMKVLTEIHPENCTGDWIEFWRDIKLKQILD